MWSEEDCDRADAWRDAQKDRTIGANAIRDRIEAEIDACDLGLESGPMSEPDRQAEIVRSSAGCANVVYPPPGWEKERESDY